nr:protein YrbB [Raoultella sp. NCTC 9187]
MSGQLSWTRSGECLALQGELDQDLLVPLWDDRLQVTEGVSTIDLNA